MSQTIDQVYRDYKTQGVPASGDHEPDKREIRALLKMIQNSGGQSVTRNTLTALNGVTPPNENYMGIVLTGSGAGYYYRSGGAWVFGRGFPDSVTVWTQTGGSGSAYQVAIGIGVDPSSVALAVFTPDDTNSAGATVNVSGEVRPILSATGAPIAAGELLAGRAAMLVNAADGWRVVSSQSRMTFRGAWASGTAYDRDDLAENGGSVWIAKRPNTGVTPTEGDDWTLFLPGVSVGDGSITEPKYASGSVSGRALGDEVKGLLDSAPLKNPYKYKPIFSLPGKFSAYDSIVSTEGYSSLYASGHILDYVHREIWVCWPATGGDSANWFVVYDMDTLTEKTYFKGGLRWSKCFVVRDTDSGRELITTNTANTFLATYDVSTLPVAGSSLTPASISTALVGRALSKLGDTIMSGYEWVETNNVSTFSTFILSDLETLAPRSVVRISPSVSGDANGTSTKLLKTQGVALCPGYVAFAYGGLTGPDTVPDLLDRRDVQGIALSDMAGNVLVSGLFNPLTAMSILEDLGYTVTRFEHEGLFYSEETQKLSTIWHHAGREYPFMIVEAFSNDADAFDMSPAAIEAPVNVPLKATLLRNDRGSGSTLNPGTGEVMTTISDVLNMMNLYQMRSLDWYSTNFDIDWFDASPIAPSMWVRIERAHDARSLIFIENDYRREKHIAVLTGGVWSIDRTSVTGSMPVQANKNGTGQTIESASNVKITFTNEIVDVGGRYDAANSRLTPAAGERWRIIGHVNFTSGMTVGDLLQVYIYKNGSTFRRTQMRASATAEQTVEVQAFTDVGNGTDYYEIYAYAQSGAVINGSGGQTWLEADLAN